MDIKGSVPSLLHLDLSTKESKLEVPRMMHLQSIANQLPNAFPDTKTVTKSHIPAANAPACIKISNEEGNTRESKTRLKRGRLSGSKNENPRKQKDVEINDTTKVAEIILEETNNEDTKKVEHHETKSNHEIYINYIHNKKIWKRN